MSKLSDATRAKLKTVSTATVATALYKRGLRIQCIQDVHPLSTDQPTLVGEAFTLRYMPAREDLNKLEVFRDRSHPQRKAIEDCPVGAVLVMDSRKDARAASAGAILVTRLMQRGCAGVITDGGFRDSAEIADLGCDIHIGEIYLMTKRDQFGCFLGRYDACNASDLERVAFWTFFLANSSDSFR